jgi:V8-like Glu-specific endopeptidase
LSSTAVKKYSSRFGEGDFMTAYRLATAAFLVASVVLLMPGAELGAAPPPAIRTAVLLVAKRNPTSGESVPIGTAFHIGDGWYRSAAHVVTATLPRRFEGKGLDQWSLIDSDESGNPRGFVGPFDIACVDARWKRKEDDGVFPHDSALIRQTSGSIPGVVLRPADRRPAVGDVVSVWGFPEGRVLFESRSRVLEVSREWVVVQNESGHPTIGGHSGSPVVDRGESVIGILVGGGPGIVARQRAVPIWDAEQGCPNPK